jgi:signal transduction histidine kinase
LKDTIQEVVDVL